VPALAVLRFRLTTPEGKKYLQSQELNHSESSSVDSLMQKELKRSGPRSQNLLTVLGPQAHMSRCLRVSGNIRNSIRRHMCM
jgi:hypothetical protein